MSANNCKDIYEVLDAVRKRPAMYLGNRGNKSFIALIAFITGLGFSELDEGDPPFWKFTHWIGGRIEGISKTLPWEWMDQEYGSEQAFDQFFELLDEYRACQIICVGKAIIQTHNLTSLKKPVEIQIFQFVPSNVYYLLEVYVDKRYEYFPCQKSFDAAKEKAKSRWGVLNDAWLSF